MMENFTNLYNTSNLQPLVSIIMPCFNTEKYIAQSIESVIAQTYKNWELLITDDCSTDKSTEIIETFCAKDKRINLLKSEKHNGIAGTRNLSLNRANGRFIAFLDSDDLWTKNKLETQVGFMLENNIGFSYTSYQIIDNEDISINKTIKTAGIINYNKYLRNTIIGCGTVMLDKEIVGDFSVPNFDTSEDMASWLNIMRKGFAAYPLDKILLRYRLTQNSASSKKFKAAKDVWKVYRVNENLPVLTSMFCFVCYAFNAVKKRLF